MAYDPRTMAAPQPPRSGTVSAPGAVPLPARKQQSYQLEVPKKLGGAATVSSRGAVDQLMANKGKKHKLAKRMLKLLKAKFLAISDYAYELGHPSHVWEDEASIGEFYQLCLELCNEVEPILRKEHMLLIFDDTPMYVLGDIHGNYKDLMLFEKTFWRLGINLCPANILCLGDFVDRGPHSLETIAYLMALKLIAPHKVFMIRGNHEVKDVNGDFAVYGKTSFLYQCSALFGQTKGRRVWDAFNLCFDQLPIAAIINQKIFCVHGGVPRQLMRAKEKILNEIEHIPKGYVDIARNELVNDLLWADPSIQNEERNIQPSDRFPEGFAPNSLRGGEACVFGVGAVNYFTKVTGCTHIIRAHQPPDMGVSLGKNARVITVFSSSHYCGQFNSAAVVLVADYKIHVIVTTHNKRLVDSPRASKNMEEVRQLMEQQNLQESYEEPLDGEGNQQEPEYELQQPQYEQNNHQALHSPPPPAPASSQGTGSFFQPSILANFNVQPPAYGTQKIKTPTPVASVPPPPIPTMPRSSSSGTIDRGKPRTFGSALGFQRSNPNSTSPSTSPTGSPRGNSPVNP